MLRFISYLAVIVVTSFTEGYSTGRWADFATPFHILAVDAGTFIRENMMRHSYILAAFTLFLPAQLHAQTVATDPWRTPQGSAIGEMLGQFSAAARARDAKAYASFYAEDAHWINAFGDKRKGRKEIETFLTRLFAHPGERDTKGTMVGAPTLLLVRPDVAVVQWLILGEGQRDDADKLLPNRKTHHSLVVTMEKDRWVVVNHVIMDEREPFSREIPKQ